MDLFVFLAVLAAAVMHAGWNVMVKLRLDGFLSIFLIQGMMAFFGIGMLIAFPLPSVESLPYAVASGLIHLLYFMFLARSYRTGDLSQVYPIARGAAPLLTLLIAWVAVDESIGIRGLLGIGLLVSGIWFISLFGRRGVRLDGATLGYALGTSALIAAYTVVDGLGGRVSGSPSGYAGAVFVFDAIFLVIAVLAIRGPSVFPKIAPYWKTGAIGAALSGSAYWIAIWAMSHAPIASVAALRETSILAVIVLSRQVLRETITFSRATGAVLIVSGAALIRLA